MRRWMLLAGLLLSACTWKGKQTLCASDSDCSAGRTCFKLASSDDEGVCIADWSIALKVSVPTTTLLGPTAIDATATLTLTSDSADAPAAPLSVNVLVGGVAAGTLAYQSASGLTASYSGSFTAPSGVDGQAEVVASVAHGTIDEAQSTPLTFTVDTTAPTVSDVVATCDGQDNSVTCLRDGTLAVSATVTDTHLNSGVTLTVDTDEANALSMSGTEPSFSAAASLSSWVFPAFSKTVNLVVEATDSVGNSTRVSVPFEVTRLKWSYDPGLGVATTSPAVSDDGSVIVAGVAATGSAAQLRSVNPSDGSEAWSVLLGTDAPVTWAPSMADGTLFTGSTSSGLYAVTESSGGEWSVLSGTPCTVSTSATPTVRTPVINDGVAYSGMGDELLGVSISSHCGTPAAVSDSYSVSGAIVTSSLYGSAMMYVPLAKTAGQSAVGIYTPKTGTPTLLTPYQTLALGSEAISSPLVIESGGTVLAAAGTALYRISYADDGSGGLLWSWNSLATLGYSVKSLLVASTGEIIAGTQGGIIHRLSSTGTGSWSVSGLDSDVTGMALTESGTLSTATIYAVTSAGNLYAVDTSATDDTAKVVWSTASISPAPFGNTTLDFPVIAPASESGRLPVLYVGSGSGLLHAVIVDGNLATDAPWPAAHHDARNTGNSATSIP